jgi:hypothetical protein
MAGLMGLVKYGVEQQLKKKQPFNLDHIINKINGGLHLYIYMMNESGLGAIDEYVDYCIDQLEKIDILILKSINDEGNTLLHELCFFSEKVGQKFSHRLFEYLIIKGLDTSIKNNEDQTCISYLSDWKSLDRE